MWNSDGLMGILNRQIFGESFSSLLVPVAPTDRRLNAAAAPEGEYRDAFVALRDESVLPFLTNLLEEA
jgi:hypothetical protein